ncbi:MAG: hypothetical protein CM15mP112_09700 [Flavobacteriales bacterium]|nr:MAG: hypothetical protein CM15mP112_09700 [Flavobacteriales bacterium]
MEHGIQLIFDLTPEQVAIQAGIDDFLQMSENQNSEFCGMILKIWNNYMMLGVVLQLFKCWIYNNTGMSLKTTFVFTSSIFIFGQINPVNFENPVLGKAGLDGI